MIKLDFNKIKLNKVFLKGEFKMKKVFRYFLFLIILLFMYFLVVKLNYDFYI